MYDNVCPKEENEKAAGLDYNAENVWKLSPSPPRNTTGCSLTLPANYQTKLIAGERYHLLWPGGRIDSWDWDTEQQHVNLSTYPKAGEKPPIVLLPAAGIVFKAVVTDKPFYHRENILDPEAPHRSFEKANAIELLTRLLERNPLKTGTCTKGATRREREATGPAARARRRERMERTAAQYDSGYFTD